MKRKYYSKTYLRDVRKYKIYFDFSNDDYITCVKKMIDCDDFIAQEGHKLISNGYYIVEIMPNSEHYTMRAYLNDKFNVQEYYFDVVSNKGVDSETKIPFYDDLYLDVVDAKKGLLIYDKNELDEAHTDGIVNDELYQMAIDTANNLMNEIREGTNKYRNLDLKELISNVIG